jgi:L-rhamnose isomerase/sugar isomerase
MERRRDFTMSFSNSDEYKILCEKLSGRGIDIEAVKERLKAQVLETPSWGYGDSGTRFAVFHQPGAARNIREKIEDAAQVHKFTGIAPLVAIHALWDVPDGRIKEVKEYAESLGLRIGSMNPNVFEDQIYRFGSLASPDRGAREKALDHILQCIEMAEEAGSRILSLWLADGTNYPGQDDFRRRKHRLEEGLKRVYEALAPKGMTMLIEYKLFEPAFYHTDVADWGMAYVLCMKCGERAKVLMDLGHHAHGVNIEHIVSFLIDEGRLGGFHFNNKKYADDDLTAGSINPYELFLIYNEIASAQEDPSLSTDIAFMIDQAANIKPKIEDMIQTVMNLQTAYAKALIVDRKGLRDAQEAMDIVGAERILVEAYQTDVSPLLKVLREEMGVPPDPLDAFRRSGYMERVISERG